MAERTVSVRLLARTSQYEEAMRRAAASTRRLAEETNRVSPDTQRLEQALTRLDGTLGNVDQHLQRAGRSAEESHKRFRPLLTTILALGPSLVPIGAVAAASAGSLALMGGAGVLAFKGIKNEMAANTALGRQYSAQVTVLKNDLAILEHTAAKGVLGPFTDTVAELQREMPNFNQEIGIFANLVGRTGGNIAEGLISGFHVLEPLLVDIGNGFEHLSEKFLAWVNGGGLQRFGEYAESVLPEVEKDLSEITQAVVTLAKGFGPLGLSSLSALGLIARLLNAMPLGVLQTLIPLLVSGYVAFQAYQGLRGIAGAVREFSTSLTGATVAERALTASAGAIGVALAALSLVFAFHEHEVRKNESAVNDLTAALLASKGVIDQSVIGVVYDALSKSDAFAKAKTAGVNLDMLTEAALGNASAIKQLLDAQKAAHDAANELFPTANGVPLPPMGGGQGPAQMQWRAAADKAQAYDDIVKAVTAESGAFGDASSAAAQKLAVLEAVTGHTAGAAQSATDAVKNFTDALDLASAAAGGDVVRSQDAAQRALDNLASTLHQGKGAFDAFSAAGLDSRSATDQAASAAATYSAQVYKQTGSVTQAAAAYEQWYDALVATAQQQGVSKQQLDAYLYSVGRLPSQVDAALAKGMTQAGQNAAANLVAGLDSQAGGAATAGANVALAFLSRFEALLSSNSIGRLVLPILGLPTVPTKQLPLRRGIATGSSVGSGGKSALQTALDKVKARDDLLDAQARAAIAPTNKLALAQEAVADATRRLNNETKKGTTEYYEALVKLHQAQSDLTDEIKSENQARADAQKQLLTDRNALHDLLAQEASTTKQFYADMTKAAQDHAAQDAQLIKSRQTDLENWIGAADKAKVQWGSSLSYLTGNIDDQIDQFSEWMQLLADARKRGVSEQVIKALGLDKGPEALGQLKQFSNATQDQIDALNKAVAAKNDVAGQEAQDEAVHRYGDLGQALIDEQKRYADAVLSLQQQFQQDMANLAKQAADVQQKITQDQTSLNSMYHQVGTAGHPGWAPGTDLYLKEPDGTFYHLSPGQLAAQGPNTPIYARTFDVGGMLMPGHTIAYNGTGRPEHVLTDQQLAALGGDVVVHNTITLDGKVIDQQISRFNGRKRNAILVGGVR